MISFPSWFSIYCKPNKPQPPNKTVQQYDLIRKDNVSSGDMIDLSTVPNGTTHICFEAIAGFDHEVDKSVGFYFCKTVPNPNYEKSFEYYLKELKSYEERITEWEKYKKIHDEYTESEEKKKRRALYEKLKQEFEH